MLADDPLQSKPEHKGEHYVCERVPRTGANTSRSDFAASWYCCSRVFQGGLEKNNQMRRDIRLFQRVCVDSAHRDVKLLRWALSWLEELRGFCVGDIVAIVENKLPEN